MNFAAFRGRIAVVVKNHLKELQKYADNLGGRIHCLVGADKSHEAIAAAAAKLHEELTQTFPRSREGDVKHRGTPVERLVSKIDEQHMVDLVELAVRHPKRFKYFMDSFVRHLAYDSHNGVVHSLDFLSRYLYENDFRRVFFSRRLREMSSELPEGTHHLFLMRLLTLAENPRLVVRMVARAHASFEDKGKTVALINLLHRYAENTFDFNAAVSLLGKTSKDELPAAIGFLNALHPPRYPPYEVDTALRARQENILAGISEAGLKERAANALRRAGGFSESWERALRFLEATKKARPADFSKAVAFLERFYSHSPEPLERAPFVYRNSNR